MQILNLPSVEDGEEGETRAAKAVGGVPENGREARDGL